MCSESKIGDENIEQIENRLCGFSTISLSFIMGDHRKGSYKRTSGFTINFLLKTSHIPFDLMLIVEGRFGLEKFL